MVGIAILKSICRPFVGQVILDIWVSINGIDFSLYRVKAGNIDTHSQIDTLGLCIPVNFDLYDRYA